MSRKSLSIIIIIIILLSVGALYFSQRLLLEKTESAPVTKTVKEPYFTSGYLVGTVNNPALGKYLTDTKGMTLYTFADDKKGESVCFKECRQKWPIYEYNNLDVTLTKDLLSKKMSVTKRSDGWYQYVYGNQPVYYYGGDKKMGDINGNGLGGGKWNIIPIK